MKPLYDRNRIGELIPQRPPFVLIDEFCGFEGPAAVCALTVRSDNLLAEGGTLSEAGLLEHMAQSAAAREGYLARGRGEPVRLGFIGAVNDAEFVRLPRTGERIVTRVEVIETVMHIALVAVTSRVGDSIAARCRMKIVTEQA